MSNKEKKPAYKSINTPICDFVEQYRSSFSARFHMPGHKGKGNGYENDITEITGADSLYSASGIIAESMKNAGEIFGADTFYSAEGSSLSIRAMVYLTCLYAKNKNKKCRILAGRNAHKSFLSAIILTNAEIEWIYPQDGESYLSCGVTAERIKEILSSSGKNMPTALYITSPDYLGNTVDISSISAVCKNCGVLLLVDNAHGAYLKFFGRHPIEQGADMCADSAHKTLPVLTGGAYLHINRAADKFFKENALGALSLFGSTSPSYLILASLDRANALISSGYDEKIIKLCKEIDRIKQKLISYGYKLIGDEPMKITVCAESVGYTGYELNEKLLDNRLIAEFFDFNYLTLMLSPENGSDELARLLSVLLSVQKKAPNIVGEERFIKPKRAMSAREAAFYPSVKMRAKDALGKVLATVSVGCPPAVPILVSGEIVDENAIELFKRYGIEYIDVIDK
ncbi:MAG: amino acid decarboxylase [Clostridia bacterium]|nr:amino acid decarboxylase [Clostridia bacterium]